MAILLYGFLGLAAILLEEYILGAFAGFTALNFYIVIIPIGTIILGGFLGLVLHFGMLRGRIAYGRLLLVMAITIAILSYPAIRYMEYRTTYFQYNEAADRISFNRKFQGYPIQELGISFLTYEQEHLDYDNFTITYKQYIGRNSLKIPTCSFLNYLDYLFNWICLVLACICVFVGLAKDTPYCADCRRYYRENLLFQFRPNVYQNILEEIPKNLDRLEEFAEEHEANVSNYREYYEAYRAYCPDCRKGEIQIRHQVTEGNSISEAEDERKIIPTDRVR